MPIYFSNTKKCINNIIINVHFFNFLIALSFLCSDILENAVQFDRLFGRHGKSPKAALAVALS